MTTSHFHLLLAFALLNAPLHSTTIQVTNAGFESVGTDGRPAGWSLRADRPGVPVTAGIDTQVRHGGEKSFTFYHPGLASSTIVSSPLTLEVGKLYRLSGWIRTDEALSDPMARYPTPVAATLTMESFPFTNFSLPVGGTTFSAKTPQESDPQGWRKSEILFIATEKADRVMIHLGFNGTATGKAWFDDVQVEEVEDIAEYIPPETVRWFGPAFRYTDRGWTFVHIEGEPYQRGYQYGFLVAREIGAYVEKLAVRANPDNPKAGWEGMRTLTDALLLRKYDEEFLSEMRGIAEGAAKGGGTFGGKSMDFLDIVTLNSAVDLGQLSGALAKTTHSLSGRSFRQEEEELNAPERLHKCSSFLANGPATKDGKIVFGQLFMWNGYTGVHWDIICDVVPSKGRHLVYETFPGGIHSGADFYINDAGIMIGETTVMQTPFNPDGTPQSLRIRKAAQYAASIDDVVRILTERNNGLYTNDWLIADAKSNETAILLLGTNKYKLWRSGKGDYPGGTEGFYWSVNNPKDPEVRKEYVPDPTNAPFDVVFSPVNRDIAFYNYYQNEKGKIDAISAVNVLATSPLNRPHACDGKITTSDMAEKMVFLAHYGKVTLREKFPEKGSRLIADLPNASPHLTLGHSVISPIFVTEKLKALHEKEQQRKTSVRPEVVIAAAREVFSFPKAKLWSNTVYPSSDADNWFVSGTAAYWNMINGLPGDPAAAAPALRDQLAELNCRLQYLLSREKPIAPAKAQRRYDGYAGYQIPRIRGTYLLHQLRLKLGNESFAALMGTLHEKFREKPMTTAQFVARAGEVGKSDVRSFIGQWLDREDLPDPHVTASVAQAGDGWNVTLDVTQPGVPYQFLSTVVLEAERTTQWELVEVTRSPETVILKCKEKPRRILFNAGNDIPVARENFYTYANFFDDFKHTTIVYGTARQIEANRTLALRYQTVVADVFTEDLLPVKKESEISEAELSSDLVLLGGPADNGLTRSLADRLGLTLGKNMFRWRGKTFGDPDDGLFVALPNPAGLKKVVYCFVANSALQLHQMTKRHQSLPGWAVFKGEQVTEKGYAPMDRLEIDLAGKQ